MLDIDNVFHMQEEEKEKQKKAAVGGGKKLLSTADHWEIMENILSCDTFLEVNTN